ncbi:MAG: oligoendopeptidase F, partial [Exiguobacterium sp.]|nr:oligoendopeptidase F [Exiguobacterium sp.]
MSEVLTRQQVPVEETWNLETIYSNDEAWESDFQALKEKVPALIGFKGRLGESAETLYEALQLRDDLSRQLHKLYTYAHMRYDEDTANSHYQALNDRAGSLASQVSAQLAFMTPELLSIDENQIEAFMEQNESLRVYRHAFDELALERPHVLTEAEEAILAQAGDVLGQSSSTFGMLNNAD